MNKYYDKLKQELDKIIEEEKDKEISILVKEVNDTEEIYSYNANKIFIAASVIKVPIMLAVLEEVKNKNVNLSDEILVGANNLLKEVEVSEQSEVFENGEQMCSLEELINWMIIKSDNVATNVIIEKFGMNLINQYIKEKLECNNTILKRKMVDTDAVKNGLDNYITQADMDCIFEKLFNREILNEELCEKAINILYNQRISNQISRYVYKPYKFAHKTGSLEYLNSDVGVINIKDKLYYIGVSIYDLSNKKPNRKLAGRIGKSIISHLEKII